MKLTEASELLFSKKIYICNQIRDTAFLPAKTATGPKHPLGQWLSREHVYLCCRSHWFCRLLKRCSAVIMAALTSCRAGKYAKLRMVRGLRLTLIRVVL